MPGLNQTGPMGQGPMTGRRMGGCTNFGAYQKRQSGATTDDSNENQPGDFRARGFGFGWGRGGRGRGMGRQNRFRARW